MRNPVKRRRSAVALAALAALATALVAVTAASASTQRPAASLGNAFVNVVPAVGSVADPGIYQGRPSSDLGPTWAATLVRYKVPKAGATALEGPFAVEPFLAESFTRNSDGSYTFKLRANAKSEYGNAVSCTDVQWSFQRAIAVDGVSRFLFNVGGIDPANPITIIDSTTCKMNVRYNSPFVVGVLTWYGMGILDSVELKKKATDSDPWAKSYLTSRSATFGPYKIDGFQPAQTIFLTPNPGYFGKKPPFGRVVIRAVPDSGTRLQLMLNGQASHTSYLDYAQFASAAASKDVTSIPGLDSNMDVLALNTKDVHFADVNVRKAISLAIDREGLLKTVYRGYGKVAGAQISSALPVPEKQAQTKRDVAAAKALLAKTQWPNGFEFKLSGTPARPGSYVGDMISKIQADLQAIGVKVVPEIVASSTEFEANRAARKLQAWIITDRPVIVDPIYYISLYHSPTGSQNFHGYVNPKVESLLKLAATSAPGKRQNRWVGSMIKILNDEVPWVPLIETINGHVFAKNLTGYVDFPTNVVYPDTLRYVK